MPRTLSLFHHHKILYSIFCLIAGIYLAGCAPKPYASENKIHSQRLRILKQTLTEKPDGDTIKWVGTSNFNLRKPGYVIIHHTAQQSCEQTIKAFTTDSSQVSAHYVICKDGRIVQMLNDYLRAWHAGLGSWGGNMDINSGSIGIELDNNGIDSFPEIQISKLEELLHRLKEKYNIPLQNFIGHADIAPGRKVDPNITFPWSRLAVNGFGRWYTDTADVVVPESFDPVIALKIIGYSVARPEVSMQVFRQHFLQSTAIGLISEAEKKILFVLMRASL